MTSLLDALLSQSTGASLPQPSSRRAPGQLASGLWAHGLWSQERRQEQGSLPPPAHAVHRSGQLGVTHGCSLSPGTRWGGSSPSPADWFWLGGGSLRGACCLEVFSWPWSCSLASQMWTRSRPLSAESAGHAAEVLWVPPVITGCPRPPCPACSRLLEAGRWAGSAWPCAEARVWGCCLQSARGGGPGTSPDVGLQQGLEMLCDGNPCF